MIPRLKPRLGLGEFTAIFRPAFCEDLSRFESAFARAMGAEHAVAFPYGRSALYMLLKTLGFKDKKIICPAYTCVVVAHAIVKSGNRPVFVDCSRDSFNMDLERLPQAITSDTAAILPTSLFGYPVDLDALDRLRTAHPNLTIIQDCAHSFGATWKNRPVSAAGVAAIYGLNVSKIVNSVFGGMLTTHDALLAEKIRVKCQSELIPTGILKSLKRRIYLGSCFVAFNPQIYTLVNWLERHGYLDRFVKYYDDHTIQLPEDYLQALTPFEAAIGILQVQRYPEIIEHRRSVARFYHESFKDFEPLRLQPYDAGATYSHFVARVADRDGLLRHCLERGVQLGQLIEYCIPDMPAYREFAGSGYENAREHSRSTINLPLNVTEEQRATVVRAVKSHFKK